ncbi:MAG: hypothetical protein BGO67_07900 [Alphaproteobacteria bacterium 41-28]|nr:MAG: hypothetical protein BGO67_07900 [Alphaproteobacteria bacterium 41-28]
MTWRGYYPSSLPKPTPVKSVILQQTRGLAGPLANCYNVVFEDGSEQLVGFHSVEAFTFSELEKLMQ